MSTIVKENKTYMGLWIGKICVEKKLKILNKNYYSNWINQKAYDFEEEWDVSRDVKFYIQDIRKYIEKEFMKYIDVLEKNFTSINKEKFYLVEHIKNKIFISKELDKFTHDKPATKSVIEGKSLLNLVKTYNLEIDFEKEGEKDENIKN